MQENKLYLVFEFLSMDLKRYMDTIPSGQYMDKMLVKVIPSWLFQLDWQKTNKQTKETKKIHTHKAAWIDFQPWHS